MAGLFKRVAEAPPPFPYTLRDYHSIPVWFREAAGVPKELPPMDSPGVDPDRAWLPGQPAPIKRPA